MTLLPLAFIFPSRFGLLVTGISFAPTTASFGIAFSQSLEFLDDVFFFFGHGIL